MDEREWVIFDRLLLAAAVIVSALFAADIYFDWGWQ